MTENLGEKLAKRRWERGKSAGNFSRFENVPMNVSAVIGTTQLTARQLLNLREGKELEFKSTTNEQVDILAQGRLLARGRLVNTKNGMGVEVLELLPHKW